MSMVESKYIENKAYLARCEREWTLTLREAGTRRALELGRENEWLRCVKGDFPRRKGHTVDWQGVHARRASGAWKSRPAKVHNL
jgi:hypothetical protein